jgi:hypothetical protein
MLRDFEVLIQYREEFLMASGRSCGDSRLTVNPGRVGTGEEAISWIRAWYRVAV